MPAKFEMKSCQDCTRRALLSFILLFFFVIECLTLSCTGSLAATGVPLIVLSRRLPPLLPGL
jgi:hypothetical protein